MPLLFIALTERIMLGSFRLSARQDMESLGKVNQRRSFTSSKPVSQENGTDSSPHSLFPFQWLVAAQHLL